MGIFNPSPDPKDELIALLKDERDHLRARNAELEAALMAALNPHAYRLVHREPAPGAPADAAPRPLDPYTARTAEYKPNESLAQIKAKFGSDESGN